MNVILDRPNLPLGTKDFYIQTNGRFSHLSFERPHDVISTCQTHGGENSELDGICNYQSCEGKHHDRISSQPLHGIPERQRHRELSEEMGWEKKNVAFMGTAANMQYAMLSRCRWRDLEVHALATAGVTGNATCAGDPARYHQEGERWVPCDQPAGTINIMLHINHSLSPAALTRAIVTMTEAKTAALMDLQIGSKSSSSLATGTGTDQFAICAPMGEGEPLTWAGAHTKLGELIGKAVKDSVMGALEWQNGLDLKRCRNMFHLLGRFGFSEEVWKSMLLPHTGEERWPFFEANRDAVVHDPAVSACSSALASLMDQERKGHLPPSGILNQARHLCALMVVQVGNSPENFSAVLDELQGVGAPLEVLSKGLVLAWEKKWS